MFPPSKPWGACFPPMIAASNFTMFKEGETPTFGVFIIRQTDIVGEMTLGKPTLRKMTFGELSLEESMFSCLVPFLSSF